MIKYVSLAELVSIWAHQNGIDEYELCRAEESEMIEIEVFKDV